MWWNCRFHAIQPQGPTDCIRIAWIAGQLRQLYATRGDHDQQSVKFAAILPHRLHFHPAPSHTAPTYHKKILPQSCGCGSIPWIVDRLQIQCNPHTIQTDCSQMQQIGPGLDQIAAGLEPTQTGPGRDISSKPRQCRQRLLQPAGDCGGLGSLASDCDQNIGRAILTAVLTIQLNCDEIAKLRRIARGSKGLHQNPGKYTNCKKTSPIAPELASFRNRSGSAIHPKPWQCRHNLFQSWELWRNCIFQAIQSQFRFKPPERPTECNRPRIGPLSQPIPDCGTTDQNRLQSNWIAELQRIAMSLT